MSEEPSESMDCIGLYCPVPILQLREKIDELPIGAVLEVLADDPAAEEDFKRWAKRTGNQILEFSKEGSKLRFVIKKVTE
jgi:TusA-related sulfurtransferase